MNEEKRLHLEAVRRARERAYVDPRLEARGVVDEYISQATTTGGGDALAVAAEAVRESGQATRPHLVDVDVAVLDREAIDKKWKDLLREVRHAQEAYAFARENGNEKEIRDTAESLAYIQGVLTQFEEENNLTLPH